MGGATEEQATCAVCGNEVDCSGGQCPFCQAECAAALPSEPAPPHRMVNLERGKPLVRHALDRLEGEICSSRSQGIKVLTLIHGYGSSGEGGAIKEAVQRQLQFFLHQGRIRGIISGEAFEGRSGRGRQLLRRFPFLAAHRDLNRANPGITLIVL